MGCGVCVYIFNRIADGLCVLKLLVGNVKKRTRLSLLVNTVNNKVRPTTHSKLMTKKSFIESLI